LFEKLVVPALGLAALAPWADLQVRDGKSASYLGLVVLALFWDPSRTSMILFEKLVRPASFWYLRRPRVFLFEKLGFLVLELIEFVPCENLSALVDKFLLPALGSAQLVPWEDLSVPFEKLRPASGLSGSPPL
jgi:hypothetical protein